MAAHDIRSRASWIGCALSNVSFLALRGAVRRLRSGIAETRAQVAPYAAAWSAHNVAALEAAGRRWIVLGDSSAQGVGARSHFRGYVGQVRSSLEARDREPWQVINLSRSGVRVADCLAEQVPALAELGPASADLITCLVGTNDLLRTRERRLIADIRALFAVLPQDTVVGTLPQGLGQRKARRVNEVIRAEAFANELVVADLWAHTGPPWRGKYADDLFHPNERGYADWAAALLEVIEGRPARR